jgi:hypothetical protein
MTTQIVIAWAEQTALAPTGRNIMRDLNWFPEFRAEWEGKAAMWCRKAKAADQAKAEAYAAKEGKTVFVFDGAEKDPLGKAKAMALAKVQP